MNELHEKINQAKKDLGLSNSGLATVLGYSKPYITKVLNKLPGDKVQKRLIGEIDVLINNEKKRVNLIINGLCGRVEVKPDLQPQNSAKSKILNSGRLERRASGSVTPDKLDQCKEFVLAKHASEIHWLKKSANNNRDKAKSLESKLNNERILSVIIFAVILALFLASHAV